MFLFKANALSPITNAALFLLIMFSKPTSDCSNLGEQSQYSFSNIFSKIAEIREETGMFKRRFIPKDEQ